MKDKILEMIKEERDFDIEEMNELLDELYKKHPLKHNPVSRIKYVPLDMVQANNYNPNAVAKNELRLLSVSIDHNGYTQPTVTIYDETIGKYIIIDGFHRYFVMKTNKEIYERNNGMLPCVVLEKDINDRMASTIRHNRARGKHSVSGMANVVMEMIQNGWDDATICNELGLEVDELVRLKYSSGVAKLFKDREFSQSYKETYQLKAEKEQEDNESV